MKLWLTTRGMSIDYTTYPTEPKLDTWWDKYYPINDFDDLTIIVERSGSGAQIYLGGLPTTRRDRSSRVIRNTLVIELDDTGVPHQIVSFIRAMLHGLSDKKDATFIELWQKVDKDVGEKDVESWLHSKSDALEESLGRLRQWLGGEEPHDDIPGTDSTLRRWNRVAGSYFDRAAVDEFAESCRALLEGRKRGVAATVSLVGRRDDARKYLGSIGAGPDDLVMLLVNEPGVAGIVELEIDFPKVGPRPDRPGILPVRSLWIVLTLLSVAALALIIRRIS